LGTYGRSPSVTPQLDRLAGEGLVFERAFTVAPLALPACASLHSGLYPPRHGVRDDGIAALPSAAHTLAERAREVGFQTAAFVGSATLDEGFGLEQGFEHYSPPARSLREHGLAPDERPALETAALAEQWLAQRDRERPFLLWVHLADADEPRAPRDDLLERAGDPYLAEVAGCDVALGRLLAALRADDALDSTLVIALADHGEASGEHGETGHGAYLWNTTVEIPLIVRRPHGKGGGERVASVASLVDVLPTALAAMEIELEDGETEIDGVDLLDEDARDERGVYLESYRGFLWYGWHPLCGWADASGKLIQGHEARFFDLDADPGEERDLAGGKAAALEPYRRALAALGAAPVLAPDAEELDPTLRAALLELGHAAAATVASSVPKPGALLSLPDPHDRVDELRQLADAIASLDGGRYAEAEPALQTLLRTNPHHRRAWELLALCRLRANRGRDAVEPLEHVLGGGPVTADTWVLLGKSYIVGGDDEKAVAAFAHALELDRNHVRALQGLQVQMELGGMSAQATTFRQRFEAAITRP
jgi:arylsulfatase A-like enzyme/Tfp pilus assembly protein PilF